MWMDSAKQFHIRWLKIVCLHLIAKQEKGSSVITSMFPFKGFCYVEINKRFHTRQTSIPLLKQNSKFITIQMKNDIIVYYNLLYKIKSKLNDML